ncbi:MAG: MarR family transcriptional regulator [Clostridia bacterium]|nr:MarR family transcriptional regulator [Clostridia bacterium]
MHTEECGNMPFVELDGVDPVSLRVFHVLFRTMRFHRQLMFKMLSEKEVYPGQVGCLWIISSNDGIAQRDLARRLHVARPTVTVMLQKMEKAGIITRRNDDDDQRLTRIYLTEAGRKLQNEMNLVLADFIKIGIGQMPADDQLEFERLLSVLSSNISKKL